MKVQVFIKKIFFLIIFFSSKNLLSQSFYLNNGFSNGGFVSTCSGSFFDSNPGGYYGANEDYTVTFCSGDPGKIIQIIFSSLSISNGDTLYVYDGAGTYAPAIKVYTDIISSLEYITPSLFNSSGCITFRFVSDNLYEKNGWTSQVRCIFPCTQRIQGNIITSPAADSNGNANICFGDTVTLGAQTIYPDNNILYRQRDSTSVFQWFFGDGSDSIGLNLTKVKHVYKKNGGYYAQVYITDSNGCSSLSPIKVPVRTSLKPIFNIQSSGKICLFDTLKLQPASANGTAGIIDYPIGSFLHLPVSGDSVFLPDNPPECFSSTILIDQFATGQTLNNIADLKGIFMSMEHSYLGDITIAITAPDGKKVMLKSTVGGTPNDGTFLGEPVDESLNGGTNIPALASVIGKGYEYEFNTTPLFNTMWNECSRYTYTFMDNAGRLVTHYYLPAGSYASEDNLANLVGTPLNGNWTLEICDKQADDNGFLFNWKLEFDQSIIPPAVSYTVPIVSGIWMPASGLLDTMNFTAIVSPRVTGNYAYKFKLSDAFGCTYDTTIKIVTNGLPSKPRLGPDKKICINQPTVLSISNPQPQISYLWSNYEHDSTHIIIDQPGTYWVMATDSNGCANRDTIEVLLNLPFRISLGHDTMYCASKPNTLQPESLRGIVEWSWNTGDTTTSITINSPGTYWIQGKNTGGCWVRDSIVISENPVNSFSLPRDTGICANTSYVLSLQPPANTIITWQNGQVGTTALMKSGQTYSIVANYEGCFKNSSMEVREMSLPVFNLGRDTTLCIGYDLPMHASYPGASYRWSTGSKDSFITATTPGVYWAEANYNGCAYRDSINFSQKICDCDIVMPNAFSPNGDGVNDVYRPFIKCFPRNYQLSIFNRYGQQVFYSKDYKALWDGRYNNNPLPVGTYYYILTFLNEDLQRNERTFGNITLLR